MVLVMEGCCGRQGWHRDHTTMVMMMAEGMAVTMEVEVEVEVEVERGMGMGMVLGSIQSTI